MIFTWLFDLFITFINWLINLLPTVEYAITMNKYISPVANAVSYLDTFVSLELIIGCIALILIIDNWTMIFSILKMVWNMIPFT